MASIILKNYYFYKRNFNELLLNSFRIYLYIIPFYFFVLSNSKRNEDINFTILTLIIIGIVSNTVVNANYELYKEISSEKIASFKLSNISILKYIFSQSLFYYIIFLIEYFLVIIVLSYFKIIVFKIDLYFVVNIIILNILTYISISLIASVFSIFTIRSKRFSYSSLLITYLLLLSASYIRFDILNSTLKKISYLSPFTYIINIFRNIFNSETLIFPLLNMYLIIVTIILFISIFYKLFLEKIISENLNI